MIYSIKYFWQIHQKPRKSLLLDLKSQIGSTSSTKASVVDHLLKNTECFSDNTSISNKEDINPECRNISKSFPNFGMSDIGR